MSEQPEVQPVPTNIQLQAAPRVYANGLAVAYSKTECVLTFLFANEPLVAVILPFPFVRALSEQTAQVVKDFERRSQHKIKLPHEVIPEPV